MAALLQSDNPTIYISTEGVTGLREVEARLQKHLVRYDYKLIRAHGTRGFHAVFANTRDGERKALACYQALNDTQFLGAPQRIQMKYLISGSLADPHTNAFSVSKAAVGSDPKPTSRNAKTDIRHASGNPPAQWFKQPKTSFRNTTPGSNDKSSRVQSNSQRHDSNSRLSGISLLESQSSVSSKKVPQCFICQKEESDHDHLHRCHCRRKFHSYCHTPVITTRHVLSFSSVAPSLVANL